MEMRTGGQGRTRPVGGPSQVRRTIANRPHVASCIGRTGEVQWAGAYAWPGIVVKVGPFRGKEGRRLLPAYDH